MAIICTQDEIVAKAKDIYYKKESWTYCQGGLGELGESTRIKGLYEYYYNQPNRSKYMTLNYKDWLKQYGAGRQCTDCSNFINVLLGYPTNYYSVWKLGTLPEYKGEISTAPAGTVLWMDGHVGLQLDGGKWMDMPHYNTTYRQGDWSDDIKPLWTKAVYLPEIDYNYKNIKDIEVKVTEKQRKVGDPITYDDFIVTNIYKDGSRAENKGYNYTPSLITYDRCTVAIVYGDFVKYVTISAERSGEFFAVMVPASSAGKALETQGELIKEGYTNTAVVQI